MNKRTLYALQSHPQFNGSPYFITQAQQYHIRPQKHNSISMLYQINTPGYQLRHPLMIEFEPDEDSAVIATSPESNAYGVGESEQEAADEYIAHLEEYGYLKKVLLL